MKIDSQLPAFLFGRSSNPLIEPQTVTNRSSFISCLVGFAEELRGNASPPMNPIGIYPLDPPSDSSGEHASALVGPPVNPIASYPVAQRSNLSQDEDAQDIAPPMIGNGIYPIDPPSNGSDEDVSGSSTTPVNPVRIL